MTHPTDIDIRSSADRVIASLRLGNTREAMQILERERSGEDLVVQEALDRYVGKELPALRPRISAEDAAVFAVPIERLQTAANSMPRFPTGQELRTVSRNRVTGAEEITDLFSQEQRYDMYASIVETRGNLAARTDLAAGTQRVILGLRQENSTFESMTRDDPRTLRDESQTGKGVYDDRLVVLWKEANGTRRLFETTNGANTEPTAQYDHHAGSNGRRPYGDAALGSDTRRFAASPGYENILAPRKIEGDDVNNDGIRDLGRLAEGTVQMSRTTHPNPSNHNIPEFSLRPTAAAVTNGRGQVQRDTNGDGWFTQQDVNGVQDLNDSFKIHRGSNTSTDSAGCQTVHPSDHTAFMAAVKGPLSAGNPIQQNWQYVLTATSPGMFRGVNVERGVEQHAAAENVRQDPRHPAQQERGPQRAPQQGAPRNEPPAQENPGAQDARQHVRPVQQELRNGPANVAPPLGQPRADLDPRDRNHPDHALYQQALAGVHLHDAALGRTPDEKSERMAASLTVLAKENGIRQIDHVAFSVNNGRDVKAGDNVFVVQGEMGNSTADRAHMKTDVAVNTSMQNSFQQLESINQKQAQEVLAQQQSRQQAAQQASDGYHMRAMS